MLLRSLYLSLFVPMNAPAWRASVTGRYDHNRELVGYTLIAENVREGRLVVGCDHDHPTRAEAARCERARETLKRKTGAEPDMAQTFT